jgi:hypothetical protein
MIFIIFAISGIPSAVVVPSVGHQLSFSYKRKLQSMPKSETTNVISVKRNMEW